MRIARLLVLVLATLAPLGLGGCAAPLPPVALVTAPRAAAEVTVYVEDEAILVGDMVDENKSLSTSIPAGVSGALTRAGYQVVTDKNRPHDAVIRLSADVTSVPSIFVVKVDGRVLKDAVARVRMAIEANGIRVDEVEATTAGGKPTKPDALDRVAVELVNGLSRSDRFARLSSKGRAGADMAQRDDRPKTGSPGGGGDTLVVVNVEAPSMPSAPKGAGSPPAANSAEKPKAGATPTTANTKPKGSSQSSVSPQTTSR